MANNFCPKCGSALVNGKCPSCGFSFNDVPVRPYYYKTRLIDCYSQMFRSGDVLTSITAIAFILNSLISLTYAILVLVNGSAPVFLTYIFYVTVFIAVLYLFRYFRYGDRHPSNVFLAAASLVCGIVPLTNILLYGSYPSFFHIGPVVLMVLFVSMRLETERNIRGIFISGFITVTLWYFFMFAWQGVLFFIRNVLISYSYLVVSLAYVRNSQEYLPIAPYYGGAYYDNNNYYNN